MRTMQVLFTGVIIFAFIVTTACESPSGGDNFDTKHP